MPYPSASGGGRKMLKPVSYDHFAIHNKPHVALANDLSKAWDNISSVAIFRCDGAAENGWKSGYFST